MYEAASPRARQAAKAAPKPSGQSAWKSTRVISPIGSAPRGVKVKVGERSSVDNLHDLAGEFRIVELPTPRGGGGRLPCSLSYRSSVCHDLSQQRTAGPPDHAR